jgi:hypothetical protein
MVEVCLYNESYANKKPIAEMRLFELYEEFEKSPYLEQSLQYKLARHRI